ncbi:MAG TPA: DUF1835 domain-containing protein [Draconibacterium sp.]|nr:DUF1835 domain-containing protein [Draconibacterium sp.]
MNTYHVLNGDFLAEQLSRTKINRNFIVCRECLIEGNLRASSIGEFWKVRAEFIAGNFPESSEVYFKNSASEFEKLRALPEDSEVCLWFENDLFCQTNMWFVISILPEHKNLKVYRVFPVIKNKSDLWKGFSVSDAALLEQAFSSKVRLTNKDLELGRELWSAYQNNDFAKLTSLSSSDSACFQYLESVCKAHTDRFPKGTLPGRPDRVVKEILETVSTKFDTVFSEFSNREGIYGFGDAQLKRIYDRQMQSGI